MRLAYLHQGPRSTVLCKYEDEAILTTACISSIFCLPPFFWAFGDMSSLEFVPMMIAAKPLRFIPIFTVAECDPNRCIRIIKKC